MSHIKTQIREAVATACTGLATTGSNVFVSSVYALESLPALRIYNGAETVTPGSIHGPGILERVMQIRIEAVAKDISALDATLDQIQKEVEVAISGIEMDGVSFRLASVEEPQLSGSADKPTGQTTMTFEATFYTEEDAPDVAL
jgi:hypothetical protein